MLDFIYVFILVLGPNQHNTHWTDHRRTSFTVQLHQRPRWPLQWPQHLTRQKAWKATAVLLPVSPLLQQGSFHQGLSTGLCFWGFFCWKLRVFLILANTTICFHILAMSRTVKWQNRKIRKISQDKEGFLNIYSHQPPTPTPKGPDSFILTYKFFKM